MTTTITLPAYFNSGAISGFAGTIVGLDGLPTDNHFIFDFRYLTFIDSTGLTVFCNTLEWLRSLDVWCQFGNHNRVSAPISYLDDCGFFERHLGKKLNPYSTVRPTTLPFQKVAHAEAHGWLENRFTPWMSYKLGVPGAGLGSLRTCVKELFNNIIDHSTQENGFIHVQHHPNSGLIHIAVSDFGKGIPSNIRARFGAMSDGEAIRRASQPGVTTKSVPGNQGIGLDFLIDNVTGNRGHLSIYSFSGSLHCHVSSPGNVARTVQVSSASYPGTLVNIWLNPDTFVGDDVQEETLEW